MEELISLRSMTSSHATYCKTAESWFWLRIVEYLIRIKIEAIVIILANIYSVLSTTAWSRLFTFPGIWTWVNLTTKSSAPMFGLVRKIMTLWEGLDEKLEMLYLSNIVYYCWNCRFTSKEQWMEIEDPLFIKYLSIYSSEKLNLVHFFFRWNWREPSQQN